MRWDYPQLDINPVFPGLVDIINIFIIIIFFVIIVIIIITIIIELTHIKTVPKNLLKIKPWTAVLDLENLS